MAVTAWAIVIVVAAVVVAALSTPARSVEPVFCLLLVAAVAVAALVRATVPAASETRPRMAIGVEMATTTATICLLQAVRTVKAVPLLRKAVTTMVAAVPAGIAPDKVMAAVLVTVVGTGSAANTTAVMADLAAVPGQVMSAVITVLSLIHISEPTRPY